jgi:hypothetical protein
MRIFSVTIKKRDGKVRQMRYVRAGELPPEVGRRNIGYGKIVHQAKMGEFPEEEINERTEKMYKNTVKIRKSIPKTESREVVWDIEKSAWRSLMYERIIEGPKLESDVPMPHEAANWDDVQLRHQQNTIAYIHFIQCFFVNLDISDSDNRSAAQEKKEQHKRWLTEQLQTAIVKEDEDE